MSLSILVCTLATLMFMDTLEEDVEAGNPLRTGNASGRGPTGLYHTKDSDILLTAASDDQWRRLCTALDSIELAADPRFDTYRGRIDNVAAARQEVQTRIDKLTQAEALKRLEQADVPCGPVRTVSEIMADSHFWDRGTLLPLRHGAMDQPVAGIASGFPVVFSDGPLPTLPGAPTLGMHTMEVFGELLHCDAEKIEQMRSEGVI